MPAMAIAGSKKDLLTTAFAPMAISSAISISPKIFTPGAIQILSPSLGTRSGYPAATPMFTPICILQLDPIFAVSATAIVPLCLMANPGPKTFGGME